MCIVLMANNNSNSNGNNTDRELDRFKEILNNKIDEKKDLIFPSHSRAYNNKRLEIGIR